MLIKTISIVTWFLVAGFAILLLLLWLEPRSGSDPSTRGLGKSLNLLLILAIVCLVVFNLLPYNWSKYLGIVLGVLFAAGFVFFGLALSGSSWVFQDTRRPAAQDDKPAFDNPILNEMDAAFQKGDVETWKKLLQSHPEYIHDKKLLNHLLLETDYNGTSEAPKLACLQYLLESGAEPAYFFSNFMQIAQGGNAGMVDLLLQHGVDPNGKAETLDQRPVIFETIAGHGKIDDVIRVLIKHGADANTRFITSEYQDTLTPLLYAVYRERWSCCSALLENGADADYKTRSGVRIKDLVLQLAAEKQNQDKKSYPEFWHFVEQIKSSSGALRGHL